MSRLLFHECLGRGGYGEVYRCTWKRREMELQIAVKVLNASVARGSEAQKRLKDEARLLGALTHPGILRVYDLVELQGNVAMLAEYVDGADLDRCVLEGLPQRALLEAVSRVASALAAAWGDTSPISGRPLRLVHRDVKPENIRITPHGEAKLLDFGVARAAELRREAQTGSHTVMGSYRYMAPERFDTGLVPHPSVDVFALGCILYEGLAFRRLFEHLSMREMLVLSLPGSDRYEEYIAERLTELPDILGQSTVQLIRRLVSREPSHRPLPGRLAALCDDEADRLDGQGLSQWCRARKWGQSQVQPGEWSGRSFDLSKSGSGGFLIGSIYANPDEGVSPDRSVVEGPTLTDGVVRPAAPPAPDAPTDLLDAPAPPRLMDDRPDPDGLATEAVDLDALRARIEAEKIRFQAKKALEEETSTADLPVVESLRAQTIPDDLFDVPIHNGVSHSELPLDEDSEELEEPPDPTPAPPPRAPISRSIRKKSGSRVSAIVANLAVLGLLVGLGVLVLLGWIVFF